MTDLKTGSLRELIETGVLGESAKRAHEHYQPQIDECIREINELRSYAGALRDAALLMETEPYPTKFWHAFHALIALAKNPVTIGVDLASGPDKTIEADLELVGDQWHAKNIREVPTPDAPLTEAIVAMVEQEVATWERLSREALEHMGENASEHEAAWHAVAQVRERIRALVGKRHQMCRLCAWGPEVYTVNEIGAIPESAGVRSATLERVREILQNRDECSDSEALNAIAEVVGL